MHTPADSDDIDRAIITRIQRADLSAFDELVDRYYDRVARFIYGLIGERDVAEDLAQDIFLRVWTLGTQWAPRGSVAAYLYRAARNRALNVVDRQRVRVRAEQILKEDGVVPPPDADLLMIERVAALRVAFANLSERRRTALRLRYEEGLTYPAIASVLSMSTKSAEQLVALSIQTLRKALAMLR
jgi:RNA polymerase sigma-70 factor (ECF subfamily)